MTRTIRQVFESYVGVMAAIGGTALALSIIYRMDDRQITFGTLVATAIGFYQIGHAVAVVRERRRHS